MTSARLQSFSDGVMAIIITLSVFTIPVPKGDSLAAFVSIVPSLLVYAWGFEVIGTYWNNHHYLFKSVGEVSGRVLWANLLVLFWLSLIPLVTEWLGAHIERAWPTALYSFILLAAALSYSLLVRIVAHSTRAESVEASVRDNSRASSISLLFYALAIAFAFVYPLASYLLIVAVAAIWFVPGRQHRAHAG